MTALYGTLAGHTVRPGRSVRAQALRLVRDIFLSLRPLHGSASALLVGQFLRLDRRALDRRSPSRCATASLRQPVGQDRLCETSRAVLQSILAASSFKTPH